MGEFTMPSLGADMTEGTLTEWLVAPGDHVHKGDIVAVVDTAKADIEVECFESGRIERLLVAPGTLVPVGTVLAVIAPEGAAPAGPAEAPTPAPPATVAPPEVEAPATFPPAGPSSPLIRHLALEHGVDLATVHGSGPGGRITRADVLAARGAAARTSATDTRGSTRATPPGPPAPAPSEVPGAPTPGSGPLLGTSAGAGGRLPVTAPTSGRVRATPLARRLAADAGIDVTQLHGTGAHGAVRAEDVRAEARRQIRPPTEEPASAPGPAGLQEPTAPAAALPPDRPQARVAPGSAASRSESMRRAIGGLMARSKREIPHYYLSTTVDLGTATDWLRERNLESPVSERLVPAALLLKAAARAAREVPQLNGFWSDGAFVAAPTVHLGVAVSLRGGGLVAPALHDAADLPLPEVMGRLRDLVSRARAGRLRGSETTDPTITVTSLGDQGVEAVFGVIYPPQVALVGFGKVVQRPCAVDGLLGVRPVVTATLSADHRASDGATGARYLTALDRLLQRPEEL